MVPSPEAFQNLVGGRQTPARSGATLDSVDPATGTQVPLAKGSGSYVNPRGVAMLPGSQSNRGK